MLKAAKEVDPQLCVYPACVQCILYWIWAFTLKSVGGSVKPFLPNAGGVSSS